MKKLQAPFLLIALVLLNVSVAFAQDPPDPDSPGVPVTPGIPINENIVFLSIAGVALGITVLYKNKIKKASV